jgi:diaminopimelate decarboxylase
VAGHDLRLLAERYGTPLYLYDQVTLDDAVSACRRAPAAHYPGEAGLTYASKAFLCLAPPCPTSGCASSLAWQ